jgi:hypothetical protein
MTVVSAPLATPVARSALLRELGVAAIAGSIAGILVGGIGGRVAMRISGAMSDQALVGLARTDNGNVLGEITFGGTLALLIFVGFFAGVLGGIFYTAVRPWLRPLGRWAGLAFGLALLAAAGSLVLDPFNIDFRKFGVPVVNVLLFAALFPLFGIAHMLLADTIERRMPRALAWEIPALGVAALVVGLLAAGTVGSLIEGDRQDLGFLIPPALLAASVALRVVLGSGGLLADARTLSRRDRVISYGLLLSPVLAGLPATIAAMGVLARI